MILAAPLGIDSDVWVNFALYYLYRIGLWGTLGTVLFCAPLLMALRRTRPLKRSLILVAVMPGLACCVYLLATARWTLTVLSLDAEDPRTEEYAYRVLFKVNDLQRAVHLAIDGSQWDNVRFYAACRVAQILASNTGLSRHDTLAGLDAAAPIKPTFFGTNSITCHFFIPGFSYGPFTVREIVEQQLREIDKRGVLY
jgi:hypothetical protein